MQARTLLIWAAVILVMAIPLLLAAQSPLLAWRQPVYILAGLAGIVGFTLLLLQPLLANAALPGLHPMRARRIHRAVGVLLLSAILVHVGGLWITSPPDMIDALLLRSPTPFSLWGVLAMWAIFATALLARFRRRLNLSTWRRGHRALALVIVAGTIAHAMLIEGTMETLSKVALCVFVGAATLLIFRKRQR